MDLFRSMMISASGMKAQGTRMRVISENIANADSTGANPGAEPYRRKTVHFHNVLDRQLGMEVVDIKKIRHDRSSFNMKFEPGHPAANADGYVLYPNVNSLIEVADMKEAQRSYEANLNVLDVSRTMFQRTLEILR